MKIGFINMYDGYDWKTKMPEWFSKRIDCTIVDAKKEQADIVIIGQYNRDETFIGNPLKLFYRTEANDYCPKHDYSFGSVVNSKSCIHYPQWAFCLEEFNANIRNNTGEYFCSFVVSNGNCKRRNQLFVSLNEYKIVGSGGAYMNNIGGRVIDKYEFMSHYKFNLACENTKQDGYVTEKLLEPFAVGAIPIYWGSKSAVEDFNADAFLNISNMTVKESIDAIIKLDNDKELQCKMRNEDWCRREYLAEMESRLLSLFL